MLRLEQSSRQSSHVIWYSLCRASSGHELKATGPIRGGRPQPHPPSRYVPGPAEPKQAPPSPDYVPGLEHADDEIVAEDQPYTEDASPTAQSPDYVLESDPEADPEEDDDKDPKEDPVDYPADGGDDNDDEEGSSEDDEDDEMDIDKNEFMKNHNKTVKNKQARTRDRKEKLQEKPEQSQEKQTLQSKWSNHGQQKSTKPTIFHFHPPSFTKVQK
ncbi:hypothetical protein Tco_0002498 [Tanacetum coccineum]